MKLKRLEMVGFKSFADKTRVDFEAGITGVIGPNGCGKSNISDAIRWALGEMSARSLRSQQMMDVVFNGTANRAALGMSEVALTFDNTSRQIPLDYTEVTIARRLFRSGESEYFINKTQCRLKDVRDLFLDTGIGSDGYYVMAQGKIEFVLSAKPEERRELFEEAAGVSKYKARREEALRRLGKVDQDMLRLNDSLAIYKQQIDSLDAAVRKARQHQKIQDEWKRLDIASMLHGFQKATSDSESLQTQRAEQDQRLTALREDVARREAIVTEARSTADTLELELLELQKQAAQCESQWAKTEAERQAAVERDAELQNAQRRLEQETEQLTNDLAQWKQTQEQLMGVVQELRQNYESKNTHYKQEEDRARGEQTALHEKQKELEGAKSRLLELVRLISQHRNETVRLTSLTIRHDEASKSKQRELEKVQLRRSALDEQIRQQETQAAATQERLLTLENTLRAIDALQHQDRETLAQAQTAIQSARERIARLEAEKIALERWLSQDPVAQASAALRHQNMPGIYGPVSDLLKTSAPYQRLLDRSLGDRAHFFVADTLNDAQAAVRHLSEERQGWATFLVLDRLTHRQNLLPIDLGESRSLTQVIQCDEKFQVVLQFLLGQTFYVGETLFEEGLLRGGADPIGESFQATPTDLNRLLQELKSTQETLVVTEESRERLKVSISDREKERLPLQADRSQVQVLAQVQQESLTRLNDDRQGSETEERLLIGERDDSVQSIAKAQQALEQEEILLTTLEEEENTLQGSVGEREALLQEMRQALQTHLAVVSQCRVEAETLRERLIGQEKQEENARGRLTSIEQRFGQVRQEQTENAERLVQLKQAQEEKAALLETLRTQREGLQGALSAKADDRQALQANVRLEEETLATGRESLNQEQSLLQEADFQFRTIEAEKVRLEQNLEEIYQLSMDDAKATHAEVMPDPEELARLKKRLDNLGAVNLAAPEEHAQLEERYTFLLTQQQDLLKAKDDLHQAITKINATTREQFRTTFDQVRANFKQLYQTLFQGGEADLVLTDEQNILESGIDMVAQPPGKKLQNIALLSGGEKALTATALLFAFFMVKPSPFCLLDEVDAPLDEANVGRFIKMVKTFSEKTQFIIMTHNKRSMEMADVLYGVTMAQLGVSSLISMKLETKPKEVVAA